MKKTEKEVIDTVIGYHTAAATLSAKALADYVDQEPKETQEETDETV